MTMASNTYSHKSEQHQSGFTLIEVLIAIAILSIGLLAVAKMQVSAIQGNYFSSNTTTALTLAGQKMEDLLGKNYSTDPDLVDTDTGNNADLLSLVTKDHEELNVDEEGVSGSGIYHRVWNVADDIPITDTKTITIIVTWTKGSHTHRVHLSCIKRL
jgi:prepilin-type N-terminal cleavage/methylation domain-containing protein